MTTQEKERLWLALAVSLVIHAVAFLIVQFGDWRVAPLPEFSGPMYVEMEPMEERPETEEGIAQAQPPPDEQAREPAAEEPAEEPPPAEPPPREPAPQEPAPDEPAPATAEPRQSEPPARTEPEARQPTPDPLAGERQTDEFDPMALDGQESRPGQRAAPPESEEMPQLQPEAEATAADADLPDWATRPRETVEDAGISTEGVSEDEVQDLAEKVATDPDFRRRLQDVTNALERRTTDGTATERAPQVGPDTDTQEEPTTEDRAPGDSRFEWVGTGNRELTNPPAVPRDFFSDADFGGSVPAEASFVVVFEVDQRGNVVPGSIIFQQGSGYLSAKEKLRGRIRGWSFEPAAPNANIATGIFTLVVQREDIR